MNKIKFNKFFLVALTLLSTILILGNVCIADEITTSNEPQVYSDATILMDSKTGQILQEHDAYKTVYPASTTKLMTAILTLENCELTDTVTVNQDALNGIPSDYTIANLQVGETLTVEQLLHVLLIPSANDAANVLAYHIAGSMENFADMMNTKAKELGAENTHFVNPSGLHNDDHYSTAYDMALIGKYANQFQPIVEIAKKTEYELPSLPDGTERKFKTTNTLITKDHNSYYEYATGLKTGYTDKAKSCIVAKANKDDIELICVVLGGDKIDYKSTYRDLDCHTLFDYGFNNFTYSTICEKDEVLDMSSLNDIPEELHNATITISDSISMLVNTQVPITSEITWNSNLELPIRKNTVVGYITYNVNGNDYTVDLITKDYIFTSYSKYISYFFYILLALFILMLLILIIKHNRKKRFHRKSRSSDDRKYFRHSFY